MSRSLLLLPHVLKLNGHGNVYNYVYKKYSNTLAKQISLFILYNCRHPLNHHIRDTLLALIQHLWKWHMPNESVPYFIIFFSKKERMAPKGQTCTRVLPHKKNTKTLFRPLLSCCLKQRNVALISVNIATSPASQQLHI